MTRPALATLCALVLLAGVATAQDRSHRKVYKDAPRSDISDDPTYVHLLRYCDTGNMGEAEARCQKLLQQKGYTRTRFECAIWLAMAKGYEEIGNRQKALEAYTSCYLSCDSRKGPWHAAVAKIKEFGGVFPTYSTTATAAQPPLAPAPARPPARTPAAPVTPPPASAALTADPEYQQVRGYITAAQRASDQARAHAEYWSALTLLKVLVQKYNGTPDESALHSLTGDVLLALASSHYAWVEQSARGGGDHVNRSRERNRALQPLVQQGIRVQ